MAFQATYLKCGIELGPVFQPLFKQSVDIDVIPTSGKRL